MYFEINELQLIKINFGCSNSNKKLKMLISYNKKNYHVNTRYTYYIILHTEIYVSDYPLPKTTLS